MKKSIEILQSAMTRGMELRPKVGGFPYLAEVLRAAGVTKNIWTLPACQSIYYLDTGNVVVQMAPLVTGMVNIPNFNQDLLIQSLRIDQAGKSTFPEFLIASWEAGVIRYEVDFEKRQVAYFGAEGEAYIESYEQVEIAAA